MFQVLIEYRTTEVLDMCKIRKCTGHATKEQVHAKETKSNKTKIEILSNKDLLFLNTFS